MSSKVTMRSNARRMMSATVRAMDEATEFATQYAAREAERLTSQRFYPPASQPGKPPHQRTQELSQSIPGSVGRVRANKNEVVWKFGTTVDYGLYLELGTSDMAPRPFLRPALSKTIREMPGIMRKAFKREYRISGGLQ